ncbi:MAG: glycosyltransferase family 2 protein [Pseudomonadota bacterium]
MLTPDVSVVIPTYNRIKMLEDALSSLYAQTYSGTVEIIVVDDNSQDNTSKSIRENHTDIHLITLTENSGPSAARNRGIKVAKGRYIAFLDSDDLWEPDYLQTQYDTIEKQSKLDAKCFTVSDLYLWQTKSNTRTYCTQGIHPEFNSLLHHLLAAGSFIHTPSAAVFPRCAFDRKDLFNESLRFGEDTDFYIRLIIDGYTPTFTRKPLVIRRKHDKGQAIEFKNLDLRIQNRINTLKKYHSLIEKKEICASSEEIHAQIYTDFATQCYRSQKFIKWMQLLKKSKKYTSWQTILARLKYDFRFTITQVISSFKMRTS